MGMPTRHKIWRTGDEAWRCVGQGEPLEYGDVPDPVPGVVRTSPTGALNDAEFVVIDAVCTVADDVGASPAAGVSSTIIGARRVDQLIDNLSALEVTLTDEHLAAVDGASTPTLGFPALYYDNSATLVFSGTTIDGSGVPSSPMLSLSSTRY